MNSKVTTFNLQTACTNLMLAALSIGLTSAPALAQSAQASIGTVSPASQATGKSSSQATGKSSSQAAGQSSSQATSQANPGRFDYTNASGAAGGGAVINNTPLSNKSATGTRTGATTDAKNKTTTTTGAAAAPAQSTKSDLVALQGPTVVTQKGTGWKPTMTFVDLKEGQQTLPLTFTVTNGANGLPKMQGISVKLNGRDILAPKNFTGKDTVAVNLSGLVNSGQSQLIFQTYGPTNAACSWVLTTVKIKVTEIKPVNCAIGDVVKITGKNFPADKAAYKVSVDGKPAVVKAATATGIEFIVPVGVQGGKRTVTLFIAGVKCDPLYLKIAAAPEVTGCNMLGAAPGGDITIAGSGFSTTAGENEVLFKTTDGQLIATASPSAASETALTVNIPSSIPCPSDVLVSVKTKGQESAKGVTFFCSMRVIDKGYLN